LGKACITNPTLREMAAKYDGIPVNVVHLVVEEACLEMFPKSDVWDVFRRIEDSLGPRERKDCLNVLKHFCAGQKGCKQRHYNPVNDDCHECFQAAQRDLIKSIGCDFEGAESKYRSNIREGVNTP